jgi:PAS domain S-box-containing protein
MLETLLASNEAQRLAALHGLAILDTPPEERFDRITRTAARLFDVPIALISLVDADRQWFKSCVGLSVSETSRSVSFCAHTILGADVLLIPDTHDDPRFVDHPWVASAPHIRFYAGCPLLTPDGSRVGTLCVIDWRPRRFSEDQRQSLRDLAAWAERELLAGNRSGYSYEAEDATERKRAEQRLILQHTVTQVLAESASVGEAALKIIRIVCETFGWDAGAFWSLDRQANALRCIDTWCSPSIETPAFEELSRQIARAPGAGLPGRVLSRGEPIWIADIAHDQRFRGASAGLHSTFAIPILLGREVIGVLEFFSRDIRQPDAGLLQIFAPIGSQIGQFIEHRQAEEALRESAKRFRAMFDGAAIGIAHVNLEGRPIEVNRALRNMLGYSREELRTLNVAQHAEGDDMNFDSALFRELIAGNRDHYQVERRFRRKDDDVFWGNLTMSLVRDSDGEPQFAICMIENITERKRAEEALRKSVATNRALIDAIPDLMVRIHKDGSFMHFNAAKDVDMPTSSSESSGKTVYDAISAPLTQQAMESIARALQTGEIQVMEYQTPYNGTIHDYEARIVVSGEDEVLAIVRDITERKTVDRMKSEFISTVSHELRTPLTSIRGSLGLMIGGLAGELSPRASTMIDIAYKNSERLVRLINDILDIEKIESGKMDFVIKPTSLVPLLEQAIEANRAYGEQFGVTFRLEPVRSDLKVNADSDRLIQVITNLLSNAAKFSPSNDTVVVSVVPRDECIRVAITDHGAGIPEKFRARMFQKFAQADASDTRQKGGTGLGLSISKAIIERLGGQIGFETETDVGTTFYFDLPELHEDSYPTPAGARDKPRILICEDNPDIATLLKLMLEKSNLDADIACNAIAAKRLLAQNHYDGMTLDLMLPDQHGIALLRELRSQERTRELPVVVVSATAAQHGHDALNGDVLGIIDWLNKPIDPERLIQAVRQAIGRLDGIRPRILHIEDDRDIIQVVVALLQNSADLSAAASQVEGRQRLRERASVIARSVQPGRRSSPSRDFLGPRG